MELRHSSSVLIPVLLILLKTSLVIMARYNATILTIEVGSDLSFGLPKIGPAVLLAIKQAQKLYNDTLELNWIYRPGACGPEIVAAQAADAYYTSGFDVFIGPACSNAVEVVGHLANSWNLPLITPLGNTGSISNKTIYPRLTRLSIFMQSQFVDMVLLLMKQYSWTHMVIFNDVSSRFHDLTGITFDSLLETKKNISWTRYAISSASMTRQDYQTYLIGAKPLGRVIVILALSEASREFMLAAHALGYTSGDFVFFAVTNPSLKVNERIWKLNDKEDEAARQAYESVIFLQLAVDWIEGDAEFQQLMMNASLRDYNYTYTAGEKPSSSVLHYYEAVMIYAAVLNETLTYGKDPKDGLAVTRRMWNRTFDGLASHLVINERGDRSSDIAILDLNPDTGKPETVSVYRSDTRQIEEVMSLGIVWPNGRGPPLDVPVCGFVDEKCNAQDSADLRRIISVSVVFGTLMVAGLVVFSILFRRWQRMSKSNLWWWKISPDDLQVHSLPMAGSLASVQSGLNQNRTHLDLSTTPVIFDMAIYKGQLVRLRKLDIKNPTTNGAVLREFKMLRELLAPNLVRVYGACLEGSSPLLVTELCPKGSLQDLLGSNDFTLDTEFKISLATDIVEGLCYLHGSPVGYHGSLSSTTCLIDNRFTVKLTDFCVTSLLAQELVDTTGQEYKRECLWRAPELLRLPSHKSGSKEGDIYSYGIILSELISRASPYERELAYMTLDEILEKVKRGGNTEAIFFRPSVDIPSSLHDFCELMVSSWCEDHRQRPSASSLKKRIKTLTMKSGKSANLLDNLLRRMELYANNLEKLVEEKTAELAEEKKKTENLLYEILPKPIAQRLILGLTVPPEQYDCVTIYFSDIVGFTNISSLSTPIQVVDLLNDLYSAFDETLMAFDVYKVETIGDAYMVVSGLPQRNGDKHAQQIARMSLAIHNVISAFQIRHLPSEKLQLRIGLNSGPVCAGVVGVKMPRYCLFGDTVNTAARMESNGEGMKIHMSENTTNLLRTLGTFSILPRGDIDVKGKGMMTTYWLIGEIPPITTVDTDKSPSPFPPHLRPDLPPETTQTIDPLSAS